MPRLMKELARREMASILIEGGAGVIGQALKDRLLDRMVIYTAPKILGDQNARSAVDGLKTAHVDRCPRLRDVRWRTVGQDLVMEGYVDYVHRTR